MSPGESVLLRAASQPPVPLAGKMNGWPLSGLEDLACSSPEEPERQLGKLRGAVILHRDVHRAEDPVGRIGGTGNEEMVATRHDASSCAGDKTKARAPGSRANYCPRPYFGREHPRRSEHHGRTRNAPNNRHGAAGGPVLGGRHRGCTGSRPECRRWPPIRRSPSVGYICLALGKAAYPMAVAAVAALRERDQDLAGGLLVTPEPTPSPHARLGVAVGDHPEPGPVHSERPQLLRGSGRSGAARRRSLGPTFRRRHQPARCAGSSTHVPEPDRALPSASWLWARHNCDESGPQALLALGRQAVSRPRSLRRA